MTLQECMNQMKALREAAIKTASFSEKKYLTGSAAYTALIRSSQLINLLHESVKHELVRNGIKEGSIFPQLGATKPELKLAGAMKQKDQDISVKPCSINSTKRIISWEPMAHESKEDPYGDDLSQKIISINVRSQLSSISKNTDTLQERTFAESYNLHLQYPKIVLGEVYLIPVYEYNQESMKKNKVEFSSKEIGLAKYISFFHYLSDRQDISKDHHKYESCALLIVNFKGDTPKIYNTTDDLKKDNLLPPEFSIKLEDISFDKFIPRLLDIYKKRFPNITI